MGVALGLSLAGHPGVIIAGSPEKTEIVSAVRKIASIELLGGGWIDAGAYATAGFLYVAARGKKEAVRIEEAVKVLLREELAAPRKIPPASIEIRGFKTFAGPYSGETLLVYFREGSSGAEKIGFVGSLNGSPAVECVRRISSTRWIGRISVWLAAATAVATGIGIVLDRSGKPVKGEVTPDEILGEKLRLALAYDLRDFDPEDPSTIPRSLALILNDPMVREGIATLYALVVTASEKGPPIEGFL